MPTSGGGPYTFAIEFSGKHKIDNVNYIFKLLYTTASLTCAPSGSGTLSPSTAELFNNDVLVRAGDVVSGTCATYTAQIVDTDDNIISSQFVTIDNI